VQRLWIVLRSLPAQLSVAALGTLPFDLPEREAELSTGPFRT